MSIRERILTVRLMEKIRKDPQYAKALGIEVRQDSLKAGSEKALDRMED